MRPGSVTLLKGPAGCGKTLLGTSFLCHDQAGERGLYFSLHESAERIVSKAGGVGIPLRAALETGRVVVDWNPEQEQVADALAARLLQLVEARKVRRLVIDGLGAFMSTLVYPSRAAAFFASLFNELRARDVATLLTMEARDVASDEPPLPVSGISGLVDAIVYLRIVEVGANSHRLVCVSKTGDLPNDTSLRELRISADGIHVQATPGTAAEVLRGLRRTSAPDALTAPSTIPPSTPGSTGPAK